MTVSETERDRRRKCLTRHLGAENTNDPGTLMDTFAPDAVMMFNHVAFSTPDMIRAAHEYMGFIGNSGAFEEANNTADRESFTDTDIIVEGRFTGVHRGDFLGFPATGRHVELPFVAVYCFGDDGRLTSERIVMDLAPLNPEHSPVPPLG